MASVNFKKNTASGGAAMIGHFMRHDGRESVIYKNGFIDASRSDQNYFIDPPAGPDPTADQIVKDLRQRIQEIDELQPPKRRVKDRVVIMTYTITAPKDLPADKERAFFSIVHEELAKFSGGRSNISAGVVHHDEIHDYIAADWIRTKSRAHMHVAGVPYTAEKGINGKSFETRARMHSLNKAIDERCRKELGLSFMTGEHGQTGRTVEELQAASATAAIRQERARLKQEFKEALNN